MTEPAENENEAPQPPQPNPNLPNEESASRIAAEKCRCPEANTEGDFCKHTLAKALLFLGAKVTKAIDGLNKSMEQSKRAVGVAERNWANLTMLRNAVRELRARPSDRPEDAVWVNANYERVKEGDETAAYFLSPMQLAEIKVDRLLKEGI